MTRMFCRDCRTHWQGTHACNAVPAGGRHPWPRRGDELDRADYEAELAEQAARDAEYDALAAMPPPAPAPGYWPEIADEHRERWRTQRGWKETE